MFDFPASPTGGQTFTPPGGPTYQWDGTVWKNIGTASSGGIEEAPMDGQPYVRQLGAWVVSTGSGTGGGTTPVAPALPPTAAFNVPTGRPDGAIIGWVAGTTVPVPTATWSMTTLTGAAIMDDSGDIYLTDAAAFFAALTAPVTVTVTAANSAGSAVVAVTFTAIDDYVDLPAEYHANMILNFDIIDNREIVYSSSNGLVTFIGDKSPQNRDADNAKDKMSYALTSNIGAGKPAVRSNGSTSITSGMFFPQNPIWRGIRASGLATTSTTDRLTVIIDQKYKQTTSNIFPDESGHQDVLCGYPKGSILPNLTALLTVIIEGANLTFRLNGTQIGTLVLNSYNQPQYPVIGFWLLNVVGGSFHNTASLGQSWPWKGSAINGDIAQFVQYLNATVA